MRAYVDVPKQLSRAMDRVVKAFKTYAPTGVRFVTDPGQADFVLIHVIGYPETKELTDKLRELGTKYAIMQYCLRSTHQDCKAWMPIWQNAEAVWSYYDLNKLCKDDGVEPNFKFYHAPLGCEASDFRPWPVPKHYEIVTSGYVMETEGVLEAMEATRQLSRRQFHLGPGDPRFQGHVTAKLGIIDGNLAQTYSASKYVAALRRVEGFELPGVEGLFCGARPVCFARPHYRQWFGEFAEYIPEGDHDTVVASLYDLFASEYREVLPSEIEEAKARFHWPTLLEGFWRVVQQAPIIRVSEVRRKLLWVSDAVAPTGFANATHKILETLHEHYDVSVMGINYWGDPHPYPYPIYPANGYGSDPLGFKRLGPLVSDIRPDLIVAQTDPWHIPHYLKGAGNVPLVGFVAVDGQNCRGAQMNGLRAAIFWTQFARNEALRGGFTGPTAIVPLGVDRSLYRPLDKRACRRQLPFRKTDIEMLENAFILGNVNRNHPKKRIDLTISFFAEWIRTRKINDAFLFLHTGATGDVGVDIPQLIRYYGIANKVIDIETQANIGVSPERMVEFYNCFDVNITTTQGEGWGLPALESMACGVPVIAPDWAALGEWAKTAALLVPCTEIACTTKGINVIGGVPGRQEFIEAMDLMYRDPEARQRYAQASLELAAHPHFDWKNIGMSFHQVLEQIMEVRVVAERAEVHA